MPARLILLVVVLFSAGCTEEPWRTTDISGLMPPLDFELVSGDGSTASAGNLKGCIVLLMFGYASCPDICPATLARLTALKDQLAPERAQAVRILFVSVDPGRDSPERIDAFLDHFGGGVLGATGKEEQLRALARRYRTTFSYGVPNADGFYEVSHSSGVYVFDKTGEARLLFRPGDSIKAMKTDLMRLLGAG